jgi:hypothetical protein
MAPSELVSDAIGAIGAGGSDSVRRRRVSSDNKSDLIHRALIRLRPLLVLMRLVDSIKQRWDGKRLGLVGQSEENPLKLDDYMKKLGDTLLAKGNLQEVIGECDEIFHEYKDRILHLASVEEFLQDMGMLTRITAEGHQSLEQFILSHF